MRTFNHPKQKLCTHLTVKPHYSILQANHSTFCLYEFDYVPHVSGVIDSLSVFL